MPPLSSSIPKYYAPVWIVPIGAHLSYIIGMSIFADTHKILTLSAGFLGAFMWAVFTIFVSCFLFGKYKKFKRSMILTGCLVLLALFMGAMWQVKEFVLIAPAVVLMFFFTHLLVGEEKNALKKTELTILFFFAGPGGVLGLIMLAPETSIGASALEICLIVWWGYIAWRMETPQSKNQ